MVKKYFPYKNNKIQYIQPITDVIVLKSFINDLYLSYNNQMYELKAWVVNINGTVF